MDANTKDKKTSSLINEVAKAKRYAEEPERIKFTKFEATLRGENGIHTVNYDNGEWHCSCRFFHDWDDCPHTMSLQRILGITIPLTHQQKDVAEKILTKDSQETLLAPNIQNIRIRITETPLTPHNLATILSAITDLYVKCWLIVQRRSADLFAYHQTRNVKLLEEANLNISKITYNSPLNIDCKVDASPQGLMIALATGIDAIAQAPHRSTSITLDNKAKELAYKLQEMDAQATFADKEQARQLAAEKAELEKQAALLEIEKQRLELMAKRLEVEKMRIDYALEIAGKMVNTLRPDADEETKVLLMQTLLPDLLKLGTGKGLELALPVPQATNTNKM